MLAGMPIRMVTAPKKGNPSVETKKSKFCSSVVVDIEMLNNNKEGRRIGTCGIGDHDGLGVILIGEVEPIAEEEGADEGQVLKLLERDGRLEQLPLGLEREELVDELLGIREEVVIVVLVTVPQESPFRMDTRL